MDGVTEGVGEGNIVGSKDGSTDGKLETDGVKDGDIDGGKEGAGEVVGTMVGKGVLEGAIEGNRDGRFVAFDMFPSWVRFTGDCARAESENSSVEAFRLFCIVGNSESSQFMVGIDESSGNIVDGIKVGADMFSWLTIRGRSTKRSETIEWNRFGKGVQERATL